MCVNFGDPRFVVVNWETKKRLVLAWKFINLPKAQKPLDVHSWNLNTIWVLINAYKLGLPYFHHQKGGHRFNEIYLQLVVLHRLKDKRKQQLF